MAADRFPGRRSPEWCSGWNDSKPLGAGLKPVSHRATGSSGPLETGSDILLTSRGHRRSLAQRRFDSPPVGRVRLVCGWSSESRFGQQLPDDGRELEGVVSHEVGDLPTAPDLAGIAVTG